MSFLSGLGHVAEDIGVHVAEDVGEHLVEGVLEDGIGDLVGSLL